MALGMSLSTARPATVHEIPAGAEIPQAPVGWYVWPGVTRPMSGTFTAFGVRRSGGGGFSEDDWKTAIQSSVAHADRHGFDNIYVVRW